MDLKISVKDYKKIRDAKVDIVGLTMVKGDNSAGKSTLIKALRSFILNQYSPSSNRYGTSKAEVYVKVGDEEVTAIRTDSTSYIYKEQTFSKLGRDNLYKIIPAFPLRVLELNDDKFMPNFVFQNEIPIFGQVDIYNLFSSMFKVYSDLSGKLLEIKTTNSQNNKKLDSLLESNENYQVELNKIEQFIKNHFIYEHEYNQYLVYEELKVQSDRLENGLGQIQNLLDSPISADRSLRDMQIYEGYNFNGLESFVAFASKFSMLAEAYISNQRDIQALQEVEDSEKVCRDQLEFLEACQHYNELSLEIDELNNSLVLEFFIRESSKILCLIKQYCSNDLSMAQLVSDISQLENEIYAIEDELANYDICPLCNQEWEHKH